jgi:hypothetical protein
MADTPEVQPLMSEEMKKILAEMMKFYGDKKNSPGDFMYPGRTRGPQSPMMAAARAALMKKGENGPGDRFAKQKAMANKYTGFGAKAKGGGHSRNLDEQLSYETKEAEKRKLLNPNFFDPLQTWMKDWDMFQKTGGLPQDPQTPGGGVTGGDGDGRTGGRHPDLPVDPRRRKQGDGGGPPPPPGGGGGGDDDIDDSLNAPPPPMYGAFNPYRR